MKRGRLLQLDAGASAQPTVAAAVEQKPGQSLVSRVRSDVAVLRERGSYANRTMTRPGLLAERESVSFPSW